MGGITRYIIRQIAGPLLFITLTLTSVIWLTQSLRLLDRLIGNGLPFGSFMYLTGLLMPGLLAVILPIATFCAALYAYNRLTADSELVVMWAAGLSRAALSRPALIIGGLVTVLSYVLVLWLIPYSAGTFRTTQYEFRTNLANLLIQEGEFNTPVPGLTVYVRERLPNGEMLGLLVHDNREAQRPITMMAERGALIHTPQGPRFVLVNGNRQQIEQDREHLSLLYFDSYTLDLDAFTKNDGEGWRQPSERYIHELLWPDTQNADDRTNYWRLVVQGHRNLAQPIYVVALVLIALAATLAAEFNRRGQAARLIVAVAAAVALQVLGLGVAFLAGRWPWLMPLIYLNPLGFAAGGAYLLFSHRRRPIPEFAAVA